MHTQPNSYAKPSKSSVLRRLAAYYKPYRRVFWTDMFFAFLSAAAALVIPLVVRYVTSTVLTMDMQKAQGMILNYDADPRTDPVVQQLLHL